MPPTIKQQTSRTSFLHNTEYVLCAGFVLLMAIIFLLQAMLRKFKLTLGTSELVVYLIIWVTFLAGMITAKEKKHMAISVIADLFKKPVRNWIDTFVYGLSFTICIILALASASYIILSYQWQHTVMFIPVPLILAIMPLGFLGMGIRFLLLLTAGKKRWVIAVVGILLTLFFSLPSLLPVLELLMPPAYSPLLETINPLNESLINLLPRTAFIFLLIILITALMGAPIFIVLGGAAIMLYTMEGSLLYAIPDEASIVLKGSIIPAIPLFTLTGFVLSESKAGERLVTLCKSLFGWIPGGLTIMSVLLCAAFTTLTGGSGITILALGALLTFILESNHYSKNFSQGLITSSASTGLLFPPSIPMIMYSIVAQLDVKELFIRGLLPGILILTLLVAAGLIRSGKNKVARSTFSSKETFLALKKSVWEIILPILIIACYFSGFTTLVETAALATVYIFVVEIFIHKDLKLPDIARLFKKSLPVIGGVLIILAIARGLSSYFIITELPTKLTEWAATAIKSRYVFLLLLNFLLLVTGCLMDVYSAILVIAPLIIPLGQAFGINNFHLAIIFIANLEIGYLTPPVGLNLLLSAYRFNVPLNTTFTTIWPFLLALALSLVLITYGPLFFY